MNSLEKWILDCAENTLSEKPKVCGRSGWIHVPFMTPDGVINMAIWDCKLKKYTEIEYPKWVNNEVKYFKFKI